MLIFWNGLDIETKKNTFLFRLIVVRFNEKIYTILMITLVIIVFVICFPK